MEQFTVVEESEASSVITPGQSQKDPSNTEVKDLLEAHSEDNSLHGAKLISIIGAVCLAVFCVALDNTVCQWSHSRTHANCWRSLLLRFLL